MDYTGDKNIPEWGFWYIDYITCEDPYDAFYILVDACLEYAVIRSTVEDACAQYPDIPESEIIGDVICPYGIRRRQPYKICGDLFSLMYCCALPWRRLSRALDILTCRLFRLTFSWELPWRYDALRDVE